jgi:hypothetical protein
MDEGVAGVIFYKITNADARNKIIEALIKKKFASRYSSFWKTYLKSVSQIDKRRNEIVHWAAMTEIKDMRRETLEIEITFRPGNYWDSLNKPDQPKLNAADLRAFIDRCAVHTKMISMFVMLMRGHVESENLSMWESIFAQKFEYPVPPENPAFGLLKIIVSPSRV